MQKIEKSCGAVVFTRDFNDIRYVIIRSPDGFCCFPKGHMETGENEHQTAMREIKEETGLDAAFIGDFRAVDEYALVREGRPDITKQTVYFLAEFSGQTPHTNDREVAELLLLSFDDAMSALQHERSKQLLREAAEYIKTHQ